MRRHVAMRRDMTGPTGPMETYRVETGRVYGAHVNAPVGVLQVDYPDVVLFLLDCDEYVVPIFPRSAID